MKLKWDAKARFRYHGYLRRTMSLEHHCLFASDKSMYIVHTLNTLGLCFPEVL